MLRDRVGQALKDAMRAKDQRAVSTLRMILAGLKDRDIEARGTGNAAGVGDDEVVALLHKMVKQRRDAIALYEQGGRPELAEKEKQEIAIIEGFLPRQMNEAEIRDAVARVVADLGASGLKDVGRTMAELKARYPGQMDLAKAGGIVREALG